MANQTINKIRSNQLFIRNLPYDISTEDLISLFEHIGPIKHASVATNADNQSKGFGFVTFGLPEDAAQALLQLQGHNLRNRKIKLELSIRTKQNVSVDDQDNTKISDQDISKKSQKQLNIGNNSEKVSEVRVDESISFHEKVKQMKTHRALLFGIPVEIDRLKLRKIISKISRKSRVEILRENDPLREYLRLIYPPGQIALITADSKKNIMKLTEAIDGKTINSFLPRESEHVAERAVLFIRNEMTIKLDDAARKKRCRVIIRNLSFQADEMNVLTRIGPRYGPVVEIDIPRVKQTTEDKIGVKTKSRGFCFLTFLCEADANRAADVEQTKKITICNREVAVDLCSSKKSFTSTIPNDESIADSFTSDNDNVNIDESVGDDDSNDDSNDDNNEDNTNHDNDNTNNDGVNKPSDVDQGKTIFIRNLPFDCTDSDLTAAFKSFGKISQAILVKDRDTGLAKGSAFVKFLSADSSNRAIAESNKSDGIIINNRACRVFLAIDREKAQSLTQDKKIEKDKRYIYLSSEGLTVSEGLADEVIELRKKALTDKRKKLTNPLFFLSPTRVSIRNMSKSMNDVSLRQLCDKVLTKALTDKIVSARDMNRLLSAQGVADPTPDQLDIPTAASGKVKAIRSAKVMLDLNKIRDASPISRGFGFIEFSHHALALAFVREIQRNTSSYRSNSADKRGLLAEFAVENIRKVQILKGRELNNKSKFNEQVSRKRQLDTPGDASPIKKQRSSTLKRKRDNDEPDVVDSITNDVKSDEKKTLLRMEKKQLRADRLRRKREKRSQKRLAKRSNDTSSEVTGSSTDKKQKID